MAKVLMVIAPENFRDEELFHTREELEKAGHSVSVASLKMKEIKGMMGATVVPDLELKDARVLEFDAVVFVGGGGAEVLFKSSLALNVAKQAFDAGKVVAAICIAPCILANAGVLNGKRATVFMGAKYESCLREGGADLVRDPVVKDGKFITGNGPRAARSFGATIAEALK